ncbi:RpiB/LacA/LacB family sugar-phosphate isomerase [Candidatus Woesearchaeota archaeon]|nr:RpiB/LacA/LacB family sugar-phosphate isomerase [Candidatus Woesearchaeota archaeon]
MNLAIGSDHGGFELKEQLKKYLDKKGIAYKDFGTFSKDSCDYPDLGS